MHRLRLIRNLRSAAFILVTAGVLLGIGLLWWANRTGLPESWRIAIEKEIAKHGTHVQIGSLSYHPLRGITAGKVRLFADADRNQEISRIEEIILDFDNTKLARGEFRLSKLVLSDGRLTLPVVPNDPASGILEITRANGTLLLLDGQRLEIRNARGRVAGIDVTLDARLSKSPPGEGRQEDSSPNEGRRKLLSRVLEELKQWHFDPQQAPEIHVTLEHDARGAEATTALITLHATGVEKNQHRIESIIAEAKVRNHLLTVTSLKASNGSRKLTGHIDFDLDRQDGRFDIKSSLELPALLHSWFELAPMRDILIAGQQNLHASGSFQLKPDQRPEIHMTGSARCASAMLKGIRFDTVETSFSWRNGDLFLKDIQLLRPDGQAMGKVMIQWPLVRLELESTLLPPLYSPLFAGKPLGQVISMIDPRENAQLNLSLEGGFDLTDRKSWAYTGSADASGLSYRDVPLKALSCDFSLSSKLLDFSNGRITFDHTGYPLRIAHQGPANSTATFGNIHYSSSTKRLTLERIGGSFWPVPLLQLFSSRIADAVEPYRFHHPPRLNASGSVSFADPSRTHLKIDFQSEDQVDYQLIGSDVTLVEPSGTVTIDNRSVQIDDLRFKAFGGSAVADLEFAPDKTMAAEIRWTKLAMDDISSCYELKADCGGETTGRIEFTMTTGDISTMQGKGLVALEKSELFSVPMFGPLSHVISTVLRDRRSGFERAKSAFCSFNIEKGVVSTDDFTTHTTSLVFAGNGSVDLGERTMDMTMRLNARGLLGLITLPFRPFYGMFQFRGTGPVNDTQWEHVLFTTPNDKQRQLLLEAPKATAVETPE